MGLAGPSVSGRPCSPSEDTDEDDKIHVAYFEDPRVT